MLPSLCSWFFCFFCSYWLSLIPKIKSLINPQTSCSFIYLVKLSSLLLLFRTCKANGGLSSSQREPEANVNISLLDHSRELIQLHVHCNIIVMHLLTSSWVYDIVLSTTIYLKVYKVSRPQFYTFPGFNNFKLQELRFSRMVWVKR